MFSSTCMSTSTYINVKFGHTNSNMIMTKKILTSFWLLHAQHIVGVYNNIRITGSAKIQHFYCEYALTILPPSILAILMAVLQSAVAHWPVHIIRMYTCVNTYTCWMYCNIGEKMDFPTAGRYSLKCAVWHGVYVYVCL